MTLPKPLAVEVPSNSSRRKPPVGATDLQGLSRLGIQAVLGITDVVEGMHSAISRPSAWLGRPQPPQTRGITGLVYRSIRGATRWVGAGLEQFWDLLPPGTGASSVQRDAALAALNGIWGDELLRTHNPLAISMALRVNGQAYATQCLAPTAKVLVLVHGLCMNDRQWLHQGHDHGQALAQALGYTPLYLYYNTGRHVSQNGADLAVQLQTLVKNWPVPIQEISFLAHSMGGLVCRSALAQGKGQPWMPWVKKLVMLGTPHHGAPLERGGQWVDMALSLSPYAAPLAKLSKTRSEGITDLRHGNVLPADWQASNGHPSQKPRKDPRHPCPLPNSVASYVVAATTAAQARGFGTTLLGDGLVPLRSALGDHHDPRRALHVPPERRLTVTQANHWDLLSHTQVTATLLRWLA